MALSKNTSRATEPLASPGAARPSDAADDEDSEEAADAALDALDRAVARVESTLRAGADLLPRHKVAEEENEDAPASSAGGPEPLGEPSPPPVEAAEPSAAPEDDPPAAP